MNTPSFRIYHNPRCSKSRAACELLAEQGISAEIVDYLKNPPSVDELRRQLGQLGMKPAELVRQGETVFKELYAGRALSDEEWLQVLAAHPILIERPMIVCGEKAVIGRPIEKLIGWLESLK